MQKSLPPRGKSGATRPPAPHRRTVTTVATRPTPADQMRLRLAEDRLREVRQMDLSSTSPAALILAVKRLENALEDVIALVHETHPGQVS